MEKPDLYTLSKEVYNMCKEMGLHKTTYLQNHYYCQIVSELMAAMEAHRKGSHANMKDFRFCSQNETDYCKSYQTFIENTFEDKLAEALIALLNCAGAYNYKLTGYAQVSKPASIRTITDSIWEIISELVLCKDEEGIYLSIVELEKFCTQIFIDIWEHVSLKIMYNNMHRDIL